VTPAPEATVTPVQTTPVAGSPTVAAPQG
jgi:hypothetical protein